MSLLSQDQVTRGDHALLTDAQHHVVSTNDLSDMEAVAALVPVQK